MSHLFQLGQSVRFRRASIMRDNGIYEITRLMPPAEDQAPQYRVRSAVGQERAVREHELMAHEALGAEGADGVAQSL